MHRGTLLAELGGAVFQRISRLLKACLVLVALLSATLSVAAPFVASEFPVRSVFGQTANVSPRSHVQSELSRLDAPLSCSEVASDCQLAPTNDACCDLVCHAAWASGLGEGA